VPSGKEHANRARRTAGLGPNAGVHMVQIKPETQAHMLAYLKRGMAGF